MNLLFHLSNTTLWLVGGVIGVLALSSVIGFFLPRMWLSRRRAGRLNAFNKQLPDTITLIANALRAGSSFLQAIEMVVRESTPPVTVELERKVGPGPYRRSDQPNQVASTAPPRAPRPRCRERCVQARFRRGMKYSWRASSTCSMASRV